ncbi:hypothetical protein OKW21_000973 [Catalinimonas alkaloidigena]|uniref:hypothetical protein n=1 Tax=Catalinimonas alkaloidigena TaxID=1075417 RepID=UPI002405BCE9|nr:hypothetical protein [Catalinimonas alkaloidigena]MDF9795710.1 hypothetical protein [Catalinimonas alkaloidigena]
MSSSGKKEILGHLVDSAIRNLKRFTEVQFSSQPYRIQKYQQDELLRSNHYQNQNYEEILTLGRG